MPNTRTKPADNGTHIPPAAPIDLGDLVQTAETPVLDVSHTHARPHLVLDFTRMMDLDGSGCIKIIGSPILAAAQAHRLGQELVELSTYVGERRSLLGGAE